MADTKKRNIDNQLYDQIITNGNFVLLQEWNLKEEFIFLKHEYVDAKEFTVSFKFSRVTNNQAQEIVFKTIS